MCACLLVYVCVCVCARVCVCVLCAFDVCPVSLPTFDSGRKILSRGICSAPCGSFSERKCLREVPRASPTSPPLRFDDVCQALMARAWHLAPFMRPVGHRSGTSGASTAHPDRGSFMYHISVSFMYHISVFCYLWCATCRFFLGQHPAPHLQAHFLRPPCFRLGRA